MPTPPPSAPQEVCNGECYTYDSETRQLVRNTSTNVVCAEGSFCVENVVSPTQVPSSSPTGLPTMEVSCFCCSSFYHSLHFLRIPQHHTYSHMIFPALSIFTTAVIISLELTHWITNYGGKRTEERHVPNANMNTTN